MDIQNSRPEPEVLYKDDTSLLDSIIEATINKKPKPRAIIIYEEDLKEIPKPNTWLSLSKLRELDNKFTFRSEYLGYFPPPEPKGRWVERRFPKLAPSPVFRMMSDGDLTITLSKTEYTYEIKMVWEDEFGKIHMDKPKAMCQPGCSCSCSACDADRCDMCNCNYKY